MQEWSAYPATETFYRLLEWLNGSESVFESNDCAFSGAIANTSAQFSKRLQCSGRLMILYRDLALNTSPEQIHWLTNAAAHALRRTDQAFEWGAIGATIMPVRFTTLPGPPELQRGQQQGQAHQRRWPVFNRLPELVHRGRTLGQLER
jgi:hypothetical protein